MFLVAASVLAPTFTADAAHREVILADNPVAYYRLEELPGATTAVDSSTNAFDGAYNYNLDPSGMPDYPQLGLPGIDTNSVFFRTYRDVGNVLRFGDIRVPYNSTINPAIDVTNGAPFSAECWAQPTIQPDDYKVVMASFGPYGSGIYANASGWNFYQSPGPNSYWILNMKPVVFGQASGLRITLGRWYHLAVSYNGTNATFYVNGIAQGTFAASGYLPNPSATLHLGSGPNVGFGPFDGGVDEVAIYTYALTSAQVLAHYQSGTNSFREVPTPPSISQQPASMTNFSGAHVTFTVNALGTAPLSYQWRRENLPLLGATNNTLSFIAAFPDDDGVGFSVVVTNSVGSVTSVVATLTLETNVNIGHSPHSITRYVGSKAAFRVVANGAMPITYQWYKGTALDPILSATNDTLWLSNVQLADDASQYYATVRNPFTTAESAPATLMVVARPVTVPITGYARFVMADDPVAYWRLDEADGSGTAVDAVGSFDGTYQAGAGAFAFGSASGVPRETNGAIGLTGGSVISIPYALELNPVNAPWSAEAWVSPSSLDPGNFRTVFSSMWNSDFGNHVFGWNVYQHVAGVWTLNLFNGGSSSTFVSDFVHNPLVTNSWYHMVITHDLNTTRFYVNGMQVGAAPQTNARFVANGVNGDPAAAGGATVLGQRSDLAFHPFAGALDEVAFYNKALTLQQIRAHYLATVGLVGEWSNNRLVLRWPFGVLQQAENLAGPYANVTGASSPHIVDPVGATRFYRVQVE